MGGELRDDSPIAIPLRNEAKIKVLRAGIFYGVYWRVKT